MTTMLIDRPTSRTTGKNYRGGNVLLFLPDPSYPTKPTHENLHAIWDGCLVAATGVAKGCVSKATHSTMK